MNCTAIARTLVASAWLCSLGAFTLACSKGGEGAEEPKVVLFGIDPGAPRSAPDDCVRKGKVEVSKIGDKEPPESALRQAALDLGANAVGKIKADGNEDHMLGTKRYFKGTALFCPSLVTASSALAPGAAATAEPPASADAAPSAAPSAEPAASSTKKK